jgi:hypothetical protein
MVTTEVAGTALSLTAGWVNLGGGIWIPSVPSVQNKFMEEMDTVNPNPPSFQTNESIEISPRHWQTV